MNKRDLLNKPFGLIIIQPTSFCNINCDYCYLSSELRSEKGLISDEILHKICERTFGSSLIKQTDTVRFTWHAGEPLAVPLLFYNNFNVIIQKYKPKNITVLQQFVTNATLIDDKWCEFFKNNNFEIVVSVDGPEFINDVYRKKRNGKGTFKDVERGIQLLKKHGIDFFVLSTVTDATIRYPKELYEFYCSFDIKDVGLNFEEIIAHNTSTSLSKDNTLQEIESFISTFYQLSKNNPNLRIREFESIKGFVFYGDEFDSIQADSISPLSIVGIDKNGNFSTFSQELLDMKHERYENFFIGNVMHNTFEESIETPKFKQMYDEILHGVQLCKDTCDYFDVCGGGMPSAKLSVDSTSPFYGRFDTAESFYCRVSVKKIADIVLKNIENSI